MPRTIWLVTCGAALVAGTLRAQDIGPAQRAIQPLFTDMLAAANSHDTDRFLASFLHDSTLVFVFDGVVTTGFDAVRANQLRAWKNGASDVVYSERAPARYLALSPSIVVVTRELGSRRSDSTGHAVTGAFAITEVWQHRADGWKVVAAHESTVR